MRKLTASIIVVCGLVCAIQAFGQNRPYNILMKEIATTFASLRKNLDSNAPATAAADAAKLESLFKETEAFWAPFKTKDAIDAAKGAAETAAAVAAAAKANDVKKAQAAYAGIGKYCTGCHNAHREQLPDKTYRIKP